MLKAALFSSKKIVHLFWKVLHDFSTFESPWNGIILIVSVYNGKIYLAKFRPQAPHAEYTVVEFWRQDRNHTTNTTFLLCHVGFYLQKNMLQNSQNIAINDWMTSFRLFPFSFIVRYSKPHNHGGREILGPVSLVCSIVKQ